VLVMRLAGPRQRGLMSSIMTVLWSSGWAIAATASGFLQKSYGFGPILVVGSLAYIVSGLSIWYFERE
jgi:predicted MFS family arabinose efflux permease